MFNFGMFSSSNQQEQQQESEPMEIEEDVQTNNANFMPMQQQQQTTGFSFSPQQYTNNISQNIFMPQQQQQSFNLGANIGLAVANLREVVFPDQKVKDDDEIVAIIVTICDGSTYDNLFGNLPQEAPEGQRVKTYAANSATIRALHEMWNENSEEKTKVKESVKKVLDQLHGELGKIDPECVVFNWECCSCYSEQGFKQKDTIPIMKTLLDKGFMVMCSDFSLKALIKEWDEAILGPNPFIQIGTFSQGFVLRFDCKTLADCPSTQLQQVGELCNEGKASVHAMGGTIAYNVDVKKADNTSYSYEVLTVAKNMPGVEIKDPIHVGGDSGAAGHVLLKYPSGGQILTSCGHWVELSKLDVNTERLIQVAQTNFTNTYVQEMSADIASSSNVAERQQKTQYWAKKMVSQQAPCNTVYSKRRKGKY